MINWISKKIYNGMKTCATLSCLGLSFTLALSKWKLPNFFNERKKDTILLVDVFISQIIWFLTRKAMWPLKYFTTSEAIGWDRVMRLPRTQGRNSVASLYKLLDVINLIPLPILKVVAKAVLKMWAVSHSFISIWRKNGDLCLFASFLCLCIHWPLKYSCTTKHF